MYSELLGVLYTGVDPEELPATQEELVVILLQCRSRLRRRSRGHGRRMADDLAFQLDHDRFLLRLCSAVGIDHDPERFGVHAKAERRRLEEALRARGIDVPPDGEEEELPVDLF
jgi:FAD/FMN-containing dehydrogenase